MYDVFCASAAVPLGGGNEKDDGRGLTLARQRYKFTSQLGNPKSAPCPGCYLFLMNIISMVFNPVGVTPCNNMKAL